MGSSFAGEARAKETPSPMKRLLLDLLCCPGCGRPLTFDVGSQSGDEIVAGALHCSLLKNGEGFGAIG